MGRIKRGARHLRPKLRLERAHSRLARAVLGGRMKECSWEALKALYFGGTTEHECVAAMVGWAHEHGITLIPVKRRIPGATNAMRHYVVKFKVRPAR